MLRLLATELSGDSGLEFRPDSELIELRHCFRVFETDLGSSDHERLSEVSEHLSPQDVEVIGWGCALGNLEVDVLCIQVVIRGARIIRRRVYVLQKSLNVASRMLRASTVKTVR